MSAIGTIQGWLEDLVKDVSPSIRTSDPFRLSDASVPLEDVPKLGHSRTFEVMTATRDRVDRSITDAVEWYVVLDLKIAYLGSHYDRDLRRWADDDLERIDQTVVQAIFTGDHPAALHDVDFADEPEPVRTTEGANHQVIRRRYRARYTVPALS